MSALSNGVSITATSPRIPATAASSSWSTNTPLPLRFFVNPTSSPRYDSSIPTTSTPTKTATSTNYAGSQDGINNGIHKRGDPKNSNGIGQPNDEGRIAADQAIAGLRDACSPSDIRAGLSALHTRESHLTLRLSAALSSHQDVSRTLSRLDNLRAGLGAQVISTRAISSTMLASAAATAGRLSRNVRDLDLEKQRVEDTLRVVEQVAELKACVAGVVGSMGAPQDWEAAAGYIARAARIPDEVLRGRFAAAVVPTVEAPDGPAETLESAKESLCGLFLREFEKAAGDGDGGMVTKFFKLFPLIGRGDVGLEVYGKYVCQGVAGTAREVLKEANGGGATAARKDGLLYAGALTRLFEHVANIVDGHGGLVETHYGRGKMVKVIERLQVEVDVQGGIILDSWSDERSVDRRLTDVKSYPFSFLVQSFLSQQRPSGFAGTSRVNSPAPGPAGGGQNGDVRANEDSGINMKEVDGILNEIAIMLGRWSLYSRFLAGKCRDPNASSDAPLTFPDLLNNSNLQRKVSAKLISPYNVITTFFFRRSVEKAFQLDEMPPGLSLNASKPIDSNPPYIISAVDVVMYIVNSVIQKSISTSQRSVIDSVLPTISSLLGSDFVGMIQRKMRDESYPKAVVQGGFPPEDKIVGFIILINSLDTAVDYLTRIIEGRIKAETVIEQQQQKSNGVPPPPHEPSLPDLFPFGDDAKQVITRLHNLNSAFSAKATELLAEGITVLFNQVIRPRLRPVLSETFRDVDYALTEEELFEQHLQRQPPDGEDVDLDEVLAQVTRRFEHGWEALMRPIARLLTPKTFAAVLDQAVRYLARVLERRVWTHAGGKASGHGAIRMERDMGGVVGVVSGSGGGGHYAVREVFAKILQVLMVANMEEEEWEELVGEGEEGDGEDGMVWLLSGEERKKARTLVRR